MCICLARIHKGVESVLLSICLYITYAEVIVSAVCEKSSTRSNQWTDLTVRSSNTQSSVVFQLDGKSGASFMLTPNGTDEQISLEFQTRIFNQCLLYIALAERRKQYTTFRYKAAIILQLYNGHILVVVENKEKFHHVRQDSLPEISIGCVSNYNVCSDTQWHKIQLTFTKHVILAKVDEQSHIEQSLRHTTEQLFVREIHLGRWPISVSVSSNNASGIECRTFRGRMRHVTYSTKEADILLTDAQMSSTYATSNLSKEIINPKCINTLLVRDAAQASEEIDIDDTSRTYITFVKPGGYLLASGWSVVSTARLSFKFRTTLSNALLLYGSSISEHDVAWMENRSHFTVPREGKGGYDSFALELRDDDLFLVINMGSGTVQLSHVIVSNVKSVNRKLADGMTHHVQVIFFEGNLQITVDGTPYASYTADSGGYKFLNLNGKFYVGGMPDTIRLVSYMISPEVWSARLNKDFIGCIGNLTVDNQTWDLDLETRACWSESYVQRGCIDHPTIHSCIEAGCSNGRKCPSDWTVVSCDCSDTNLGADNCMEELTTLGFNGHQWFVVDFGPLPIQSSTESVLIRFKTQQNYGILFTTNSVTTAASDRLELRLESGYLLLRIDLGAVNKRYKHLIFVSDNTWHTVQIQRRVRFLNFTIDGSSQVYDIPNTGRFLSHKQIVIGQSEILSDNSPVDSFPRRSLNKSFVNLPQDVFIGHVMKFEFNGINYFQLAENLQNLSGPTLWRTRMEVTAHKGLQESLLEFPLKFAPHESYMNILIPENGMDYVMEFWMKFNKNFGIVCLYTAEGKEIFGLELVGGDLLLVYFDELNLKRMVRAKKSGLLTDSKWHRIRMIRKRSMYPMLILQLDGDSVYAALKASHVALNQEVFLAGIPYGSASHQHIDRLFQTTSGFAGCVAALNVSYADESQSQHTTTDLLQPINRLSSWFSYDRNRVLWHNAEPGCQINTNTAQTSRTGRCLPKTCQLDGRCVQQLGFTVCDCSMTTYTGDQCTIPSTTIRLYSKPPTYIEVEFKPAQNTTRDQLAFGIQTNRRGTTRLLSIKGSGVASDYINVFIIPFKVKHIVSVRYNMGAGQQTMMQPNVDITDGRYHIVQFIRDGGSSMLRVDLEHETTLITGGTKGKFFNKMKIIRIGSTERPVWENQSFTESSGKLDAYLTGLNFNGIELFRVLQGHVIPGVYINRKQNVQIIRNFMPNANHIFLKMQKAANQGNPVANEMQQDHYAGDQLRKETSGGFQGVPLVYPKVECHEPTDWHTWKTCKPADEDGLIKPVLNFGSEPKLFDWRADQSVQKNPHQSLDGSPGDNRRPAVMGLFTADKQNYKDAGFVSSRNLQEHVSAVDATDTPNLEQHTRVKKRFVVNLSLIVTVSAGGVCMLVAISCIIHRCVRKDEGTYNVDASAANITGQAVNNSSKRRSSVTKGSNLDIIELDVVQNRCNAVKEETTGSSKYAIIPTFTDKYWQATCSNNSLLPFTSSHEVISSKQVIDSVLSERLQSRLIKLESPLDHQHPSPNKVEGTKSLYVSKECYV